MGTPSNLSDRCWGCPRGPFPSNASLPLRGHPPPPKSSSGHTPLCRQVYSIFHLAPKPYFVKELRFTHRLGAQPPDVQAVDGSVQEVVFKATPGIHFAQAYDHYATLAPKQFYRVDRAHPLYRKCLHITSHEGYPATLLESVFADTTAPLPAAHPEVACPPAPPRAGPLRRRCASPGPVPCTSPYGGCWGGGP